MNTNQISMDGFSNPKSQRLYNEEWPDEPELKAQVEQGGQCGGCSFFAPFNGDYGLCCNSHSRHHLETVSEHFICPHLAREGWGSHSFSSDPRYFCRCTNYTPLPENIDLICLEVQWLQRSQPHSHVALVINPAIESQEGDCFALEDIKNQVEVILARHNDANS